MIDLAERHRAVSLLSPGTNQGTATAPRPGFGHALAEGADIVARMDADGQHDPAELPLLLVVVSWAVIAVSVYLAVQGAFRTGITTDEPVHVMRLHNYFDNGWYALDWDYRGAGPGGEGTNVYAYAPVTMLLLHVWSVLFGVEGWGEVSAGAHAYDVRHLGLVMISLVGLLAVAAIGRVLLRSWRWGVLAAASLAAIPMWTGFSMINVKDTPVATGHTLVTLGLLLFVRHDRPRPLVRALRLPVLTGGLVLALGTRPGMWPGLAAVVLVALAGIVLASPGWRDAVRALAELVAAHALAAVALVAVYPHVFAHPLRALPRTLETTADFNDASATPRYYVPLHLGEEIPTLLLLFALSGAVVGIVGIARRVLHLDQGDAVPAARIALVGVQAAAMPLAAVALGSDLYHGLRQLLFMIPALAVLVAVGMAWWHRRARRPWFRAVVVTLTAAALVLPTVDEVTLQPYQTTYANLATDLITEHFYDPPRRLAFDSWRVSLPELLDGVRLNERLLCKATLDPETAVAYSFYPTMNGSAEFSVRRNLDCREEPTGPLLPDHLPTLDDYDVRFYDAVFVSHSPPNCRTRTAVTRMRHGFRTVMTVLARCRMTPPVLPSAGVDVHSPDYATGRGDDLWLFAVDGWQQWPGQQHLLSPVRRAGITFGTGPECRRVGCGLLLDAVAPADLVVRVNSTVVPVRHRPDGRLEVPIDARAADRPDGVWITLTRASGGTLGLTLTGLGVEDTSLAAPTEGQ